MHILRIKMIRCYVCCACGMFLFLCSLSFLWIPTFFLFFFYFLLILPFLKPQSPTLNFYCSFSLLNVSVIYLGSNKKQSECTFSHTKYKNIYLYVNLTLFCMLVLMVVCVCRKILLKIVQRNKKKDSISMNR